MASSPKASNYVVAAVDRLGLVAVVSPAAVSGSG
jgi:hypothetical protein